MLGLVVPASIHAADADSPRQDGLMLRTRGMRVHAAVVLEVVACAGMLCVSLPLGAFAIALLRRAAPPGDVGR